MGVQPIRGVGMVRLRLRVSGARANHLCGRAEESRADTRACCERGARALQSKTCSGGNPADDWKAGNIAPGVRQKLVGARVMPPCPRRGAPSRRDAPNAGAAREPPTCSFPLTSRVRRVLRHSTDMAAAATGADLPAPVGGAACKQVRKHLDGAIRVGLTDGRVLVGRFLCFDKQRNILMNECRESRMAAAVPGDVPEKTERHLGIVIVPRKWVQTAHALAEDCQASQEID